MSKFAPVAPVHILNSMSLHLLGDYHLFLAHHTVDKDDEFRKLVKRMQLGHCPQPLNIIMDNSIVELGGAVDDQMILDAVNIVRDELQNDRSAVIPCLPDVMGSAEGTIELSNKAYESWGRIHNGAYKNGVMVVTQGESFEAFAELVNHFLVSGNFPQISWVGIPRYILNQWPKASRRKAVEYVRTVAPHIRIHLLGFSWDIFDDMKCARMQGVSGIDSAVPVRYNGMLTPITRDADIGPRGNWFEDGQLTQANGNNIQRVRSWLRK